MLKFLVKLVLKLLFIVLVSTAAINLYILLKPNELVTEENMPWINQEGANALLKLDTCYYFQTVYPDMYNRYANWRQKEITVRLKEAKIDGICAFADRDNQVIYVNPDTILVPGCGSLSSTLGHEMLHLANLPDHDFVDQKHPTADELKKDTVYSIQRACL